MKKYLLLILLLISMLSINVYAIKGQINVGTEVEDFTSSYDQNSNVFTYVGGKVYPKKESPFYIESKYSYKYKHEDSAARAQDRRKRYELYTGYAWKWDNFAFTPKMGIRFEDYASSSNGDASREATYDTVIQYRFHPSMSYKLNDKNSLFISGFTFYKKSKLNDTKRRYDGDGSLSEEFGLTYSDYSHEYDTGWRHKLSSTSIAQISVFNQYTVSKNASTLEDWQVRLKYSKVFNGKTTISPWIRAGISRKSRDKSGRGYDERDLLRHRVGITFKHRLRPTFDIFGEFNWQTTRIEGNSSDGSTYRKSDENRSQYKLGFTQRF